MEGRRNDGAVDLQNDDVVDKGPRMDDDEDRTVELRKAGVGSDVNENVCAYAVHLF